MRRAAVAYADANNTNRKLGAGAIVLVLEAGLAWAVIAGLATTFTRNKQKDFKAIDIPLPKDPPKQEPVKPQDPVKTQPQQDRHQVIDPVIDTGPSVMPTFASNDGGGAIREVVFTPPVVPTPVAPRFAAKAARPKGAMSGWVSDNDYPSADMRAEHEGRTAYRLSIDTNGKVTDCSITASSGWPGLDRATCDRITQRARFEPATNTEGERVAGTFTGAVSWRIPAE